MQPRDGRSDRPAPRLRSARGGRKKGTGRKKGGRKKGTEIGRKKGTEIIRGGKKKEAEKGDGDNYADNYLRPLFPSGLLSDQGCKFGSSMGRASAMAAAFNS